MMKKLLFLFLFLASVSVSAQYQWDYGVRMGGANYLGDIGGKEQQRRDYFWDMHLGQTRYAVGSYGRYKFSKKLAISGGFDHILIEDADIYTSYIPRRTRNLNFRNRMFELSGRAEFTLWYDNDVGNRGYYNPDFKLFAFAGLAAYYSNPQARLVYDDSERNLAEELGGDVDKLTPGEYVTDTWYNLRPLRTEGATYSSVGLAIPAGIGMYYTFNKTWRVGWEICWRKTFSDYLDDVSTYYNKPTPNNADEFDLALALQSQTYPQLLADQNSLLRLEEGNPIYEDIFPIMSLNDFRYQPQNDVTADAFQSTRGLHDPANPLVRKDSYVTSQLVVTKLVRGRSKFYKSKYSWVKNRATVRRSRAKF
ncbi:MAG: DUF6089 family protein [Flavobacteriales bacterium]